MLEEDCLLLLDPSLLLRMTEEDEETALTEDEEEEAFADEDETFEELLLDCLLLLDPSRLPPLWMTELLLGVTLDDDDFLTLELEGDPGTESGMTSEGEVPLSPPQAARATDRIMDAIMLYLKFFILYLVHIPNFFIETI